MNRIRIMIRMLAVAAMLFAPGCGTVGDVFLGAFKQAAKEAIQTATSQAVQDAAGEILGG